MFTITNHTYWCKNAAVLALSTALAAMLTLQAAQAHHPRGTTARGGSGGIVTQGADTLAAGEKVLGFTYEFIDLSRLDDQTLKDAAAEGRDVHSLGKIQGGTLGFFYGVTDIFTIGVAMPWISRSAIFEGEVDGADIMVEKLGTAEGLGDLTLTGQVRLFHNRQTGAAVAIIGGVELPTGTTGDKDLEGHSFSAEFQPGSGAVDLQLGGAVSHPVGAFGFDTSVLYVFAREGTQNADLGDRFLYNAALSFRALGESTDHGHDGGPEGHPHGPTLDLVIELNGEWSDKEVDTGVVDPDTGGNTLYLSPGLRVSSGGLAGFISVGIPVSNDYNGTQSQPDWRLMTGVSLALP